VSDVSRFRRPGPAETARLFARLRSVMDAPTVAALPLGKPYSQAQELGGTVAGGKGAASPLGTGGSTSGPHSDAPDLASHASGSRPAPHRTADHAADAADARSAPQQPAQGPGAERPSLIHEGIEKKVPCSGYRGRSTDAAGSIVAEYWAANVDELSRLGWHMVNQARRLKAKGGGNGST
jgi:hypothetical protein